MGPPIPSVNRAALILSTVSDESESSAPDACEWATRMVRRLAHQTGRERERESAHQQQACQVGKVTVNLQTELEMVPLRHIATPEHRTVATGRSWAMHPLLTLRSILP